MEEASRRESQHPQGDSERDGLLRRRNGCQDRAFGFAVGYTLQVASEAGHVRLNATRSSRWDICGAQLVAFFPGSLLRMLKLNLAHLPTPLWHNSLLDDQVGCEVWVKRDDMTSGAAAGNKLRKLEHLLGDALDRQATVVLTCGDGRRALFIHTGGLPGLLAESGLDIGVPA
jgi:hypothetical protein